MCAISTYATIVSIFLIFIHKFFFLFLDPEISSFPFVGSVASTVPYIQPELLLCLILPNSSFIENLEIYFLIIRYYQYLLFCEKLWLISS